MKLKNKIFNIIILFVALGMIYLTAECFWRGWTNLPSFFMGGISGVIIGKLNNLPKYCNLKIWKECIIGMLLILLIELIFGSIGLLYNVRFWDYTQMSLNYKGIICFPYAVLWFLLTPFCMWVEDVLRWRLIGEGRYYPILENYKGLFELK